MSHPIKQSCVCGADMPKRKGSEGMRRVPPPDDTHTNTHTHARAARAPTHTSLDWLQYKETWGWGAENRMTVQLSRLPLRLFPWGILLVCSISVWLLNLIVYPRVAQLKCKTQQTELFFACAHLEVIYNVSFILLSTDWLSLDKLFNHVGGHWAHLL